MRKRSGGGRWKGGVVDEGRGSGVWVNLWPGGGV